MTLKSWLKGSIKYAHLRWNDNIYIKLSRCGLCYNEYDDPAMLTMIPQHGYAAESESACCPLFPSLYNLLSCAQIPKPNNKRTSLRLAQVLFFAAASILFASEAIAVTADSSITVARNGLSQRRLRSYSKPVEEDDSNYSLEPDGDDPEERGFNEGQVADVGR
ncbi:hypothetical protein ON010_g17360 [Phytophthora cinnamomi]|nr:hypothetical protein ON010_g17360 [Phytophthora cinnamomi]